MLEGAGAVPLIKRRSIFNREPRSRGTTIHFFYEVYLVNLTDPCRAVVIAALEYSTWLDVVKEEKDLERVSTQSLRNMSSQ